MVVHVNHELEYVDNKNGTHTPKCKICGETFEATQCAYEFKHVDGTKDKHHEVCSVCGSEKENSQADCTFGEFTNKESYVSSKNLGTHVKVCEVCGYELKESHKYESKSQYIPHTQTEKGGAGTIMKCSVCGDTVKFIVWEDDDFKHEFQYIYDQANDQHKKVCKVCGLTETEDCDYETMNDGDSGTHSIVCKNL